MLLKDDTRKIQEQLGAACRIGSDAQLELSRPEALAHYQRLIRNIFNNTLETAFPITKEWLVPTDWQYLVSEFMEKHATQTPAVWQMPREFAGFVTANVYAKTLNKPALNDLLWLEWYEIEVHTMPDVEEPASMKTVYQLNDSLIMNPYHRIINLTYPVHKMHADKAAAKPGDYYILIYRMMDSGSVHFLEISPVHVFILQNIIQGSQSLPEIMPIVLSQFNFDNKEAIQKYLALFCSDLVDKKILIIT
ncbi:putative DNA-binding domain-containing protein [Carboxylicivirga mesophila]|uniref:DNA-binding domain-containing protein n=1 Tax=Carboxylicivirga mesophila TaxID=1166478 RepID=A0ABS5K9M3_9BACT|nr:putative DNA-binding domain-containing protein [Carboxylicivirga mesophila]MBS2211216.1 putative DNA-binding domain-containing protein [Carboxylicivirga mesophila]